MYSVNPATWNNKPPATRTLLHALARVGDGGISDYWWLLESGDTGMLQLHGGWIVYDMIMQSIILTQTHIYTLRA